MSVSRSKVVALVTAYNPEQSAVENVKKISRQVDRVVVLDNSQDLHHQMFSSIENLEYLGGKGNRGLSAAFNDYLRHCSLSDEDFVIFFDQDSSLADDHISKLVQEYKRIENVYTNIGCLGPCYYNQSTESIVKPEGSVENMPHAYRVDRIITSSMIVRFKNLRSVSFWNEKIFLDFADWDLCWRMATEGLLCFMTDQVVLMHKVGQGIKRVAGRAFGIQSPVREYYQTRDGLRLLITNYVPLAARVGIICTVFLRPWIHFLFFDNKVLRGKYISKGVIDFVHRRTGAVC